MESHSTSETFFLSAKNEIKLKRALEGCSNSYTKNQPYTS